VDGGVRRHDDLAPAEDRLDVNGDLPLGEAGLAHVELGAAQDQDHGEILRHSPVAPAVNTAQDGYLAVRASRAAEPGRGAPGDRRGGGGRSRSGRRTAAGQVAGDRLEFGVSLSGVDRVQALVEFVHGQPSVTGGIPQHAGDALPVGVGGPHISRFRGGGGIHSSQA
jgi:hypothetical protein